MSAEQRPIIEHIKEHKKVWENLWLNMADGDIIKYKEIKRMNAISEFWFFFDSWREKQQQLIEEYKRSKRQLK